MPIITIYQGASRKEEKVRNWLKQLPMRWAIDVSGGRCSSKQAGAIAYPKPELNEIVEKGPHWWERLLQDLRPYRIALQAALCELAQDASQSDYPGPLGSSLLPVSSTC